MFPWKKYWLISRPVQTKIFLSILRICTINSKGFFLAELGMGGGGHKKNFGKIYQKGERRGGKFLKIYIPKSLIEDYKPEVRQSDLGQTAEPVVFEQPAQLILNREVLLIG